ncbi:hypothetical protein [Leptospira neocaledonica]|uniref:Uncharacterized protein n=1 Tax=Leptospira neocaledonica TaxID=2023192 RepID=A0A2M9ZZD7_9LEPT|nr:hypothetical protein [Leptospira neocaledonica]PJZ77396.1 hypothetical protein CH365_07345 [Leptospira neocaledonica]
MKVLESKNYDRAYTNELEYPVVKKVRILTDFSGKLTSIKVGIVGAKSENFIKVAVDDLEYHALASSLKYESKYVIHPLEGTILYRKPKESSDSLENRIPHNAGIFLLSELDSNEESTENNKGSELTEWVKIKLESDENQIGWVKSKDIVSPDYEYNMLYRPFGDLLKDHSFIFTSKEIHPKIKIEWNGIDFDHAKCSANIRPCKVILRYDKADRLGVSFSIRVFVTEKGGASDSNFSSEYNCEIDSVFIRILTLQQKELIQAPMNCSVSLQN